MASKPVVIIVHGAWHRPSHWETVTSKLRSGGYQVETPALASASTEHVDDALAKDTAIIKDTIRRSTDTGKDVVLLLHSYAGICGSEAVAEFYQEARFHPTKGRILHLFFVSAIILEPNTMHIHDGSEAHTLDLENNLLHHLEPYHRFYRCCSTSVARKAMSQLVPQVFETLATNTKYRGWGDYNVPVTYLACKQDMALLYDPDLQKFIRRIEGAGVKDFTQKIIDTDHSPWLSAEKEFFEVLDEVLAKAEKTGVANA